MGKEQQGEVGSGPGRDDEASTESILEALLVDDAEISWDPVTGKPLVVRRSKNSLDRSPGNP
jgi:hypothetical protein